MAFRPGQARTSLPKLVYRTLKEKEKFIPPMGPDAYQHLMKLVGVPVSHKLREEPILNTLSMPPLTQLTHAISCPSDSSYSMSGSWKGKTRSQMIHVVTATTQRSDVPVSRTS
jgi:hypothetical protein